MEAKFHHLGVACQDLDREVRGYESLGYSPEREDFVDPGLGVRGRFMVGTSGHPRVELLTELPGSTVLQPWISRNIRIYHEAYLVEDIATAVAELRGTAARILGDARPAVAFDGRLVVFVALRSLQLVELIEMGDLNSGFDGGGSRK